MTPRKEGNVLNWASDIDPNALEQAGKTARLPFIHGHVALMPDAHFGLGATVGSVIATRGAIIPAAVGVDIGCGMIAVETNLTSQALPDNLGPLHGKIREAVPSGVGKGHDHVSPHFDDHYPGEGRLFQYADYEKKIARAHKQFGTLGSGNHFVEVCLDERDVVWVVLHSGSRGIGNELARHHIDGARGMMERYFIDLEDRDLAYFVEGTAEFDAYIADMLWAQQYAMGNREAMMDAVLHEFQEYVQWGWQSDDRVQPFEVSRINCHHNYTEQEHHHGQNVWLTRKGAIRARVGDRGVIPGSMGAASYIVSGLGNPASFNSASHGAGRRLGRKQAERTLDMETFVESMKGKTWNDRDAKALLDEDPRAYKDIDQVMEDQRDLVVIEHRLHQVLNYKGVS
jgi:tRNA-splicing ligase RtcB